MINDYENKIDNSSKKDSFEVIAGWVMMMAVLITFIASISMGLLVAAELCKGDDQTSTAKMVVNYIPLTLIDLTYAPNEKPQNEVILSVSEHSTEVGVLSTSGVTTEELQERMHGPLRDYAYCFIEAEEQTGVNAVFLASVAGLESGWGKSKAANTKNNLFGWTTNKGELKTFNSKEECILFVAGKMKEYYLSPEGKYFNGYEVEDINVCYNGRPEWAKAVNNIMDNLYSR